MTTTPYDAFFEDEILKSEDYTIFSVWFNSRGKYKELGLTITHGSLGFGMDGEEIYFHYGNKSAKNVKDFMRPQQFEHFGMIIDSTNLPKHKKIRCHSWLEDQDGNIYDIIKSTWRTVAASNHSSIDPKLKNWEPIEKMSKDTLRKLGLHYFAAPKETIYYLDSILHKLHMQQFLKLIK